MGVRRIRPRRFCVTPVSGPAASNGGDVVRPRSATPNPIPAGSMRCVDRSSFQSHSLMTTVRLPLLVATLLLPLILVGCDAAGEDTLSYNSDSTIPNPPFVEYRVRYTSENVSNNGQVVEDSSNATDSLNDFFRDIGFGRGTVVSARVDSVAIESFSSKALRQQKVFSYLRGATIFLGANPKTRTEIAAGEFSTIQDRVTFSGPDLTTQDVTQEIKEGPKKAFLRLDASGGAVPSEDAIDVFVYYTITVSGI